MDWILPALVALVALRNRSQSAAIVTADARADAGSFAAIATLPADALMNGSTAIVTDLNASARGGMNYETGAAWNNYERFDYVGYVWTGDEPLFGDE